MGNPLKPHSLYRMNEISKISGIFVHITNYLPDKTKITLLSCSKYFFAKKKIIKIHVKI